MNHHSKTTGPHPLPPAYRHAVERLEAALAKNTGSNAIERIDMARRALFGCLPEEPQPTEQNTEQNHS
jgi:hypothetical protein